MAQSVLGTESSGNPEPAWKSIIATLKVKAVGEAQLAEDLEQKYLSQAVTLRQQKCLACTS